jgi:hypothetical protein
VLLYIIPGKTFSQNTVSQDKLNTLAVLSTARQFITAIPDFNQEVTYVFSRTTNRRMEFNYM